MADKTLNGTKGYFGIVRSAGDHLDRRNSRRDYQVNGATHFVGKLITRSDEAAVGDIGLYEPGDSLDGVIERPHKQPADPSIDVQWDIDDALDDNSKVVCVVPEGWSGSVLSLFCEDQAGPLSVKEGAPIVGAPGGNVRVAENNLVGRMKIAEWYVDGNILVATGLAKHVAGAEGQITEVVMTCTTDGDDGSLEADVNVNGTTIFTTQSNRPIILSTDGDGTVARSTTIEAGTFVKDDKITIDIDDDGGTAPAIDVKVEVYANFGEKVGVADEDATLSATDIEILNVRMD